MSINLEIGKRIDKELSKRGWTQAKLAEKIDQSPSNISQLINGHHPPSLAILNQLASLFEVHPLVLIAGLPAEACEIGDKVAALSPQRRRIALRLFDAIMEVADSVSSWESSKGS